MKQGYLSEVFVSFQGEGSHVGERHLFIRTAGCNIRCAYCDTPGSLERTADFRIHGPGETCEIRVNPIASNDLRSLVDHILAVQGPIDAIALTGGEPLTQAGFLAEAFHNGSPLPPVLLETNGILPQRLEELLPAIDIVSMDVKIPSNTKERSFWDEHVAFLKRAQSKDVYVKILVDNDTSVSEIHQAANVVCESGGFAEVFLQPVTDPNGHATIHPNHLDRLFRCLRERRLRVRVLPQTHKMMGIR